MPVNRAPTDLANRIQRLLDERQQHAGAIAKLDETLARVAGVLTSNNSVHTAAPSSPKKAAAAVAGGTGKRKRIRRKFAVSGEQSVLAFVKSKSNPVGREIEQQWKSEGRSGTAANALSILVKAKKLKRSPLKGERGSRYLLA